MSFGCREAVKKELPGSNLISNDLFELHRQWLMLGTEIGTIRLQIPPNSTVFRIQL
jgi:hypothetical protein